MPSDREGPYVIEYDDGERTWEVEYADLETALCVAEADAGDGDAVAVRHPALGIDFHARSLDAPGAIGWLLAAAGSGPYEETEVFTTGEIVKTYLVRVLGTVNPTQGRHARGRESLRLLARNRQGVWLTQCSVCHAWFGSTYAPDAAVTLQPYVASRPTALFRQVERESIGARASDPDDAGPARMWP